MSKKEKANEAVKVDFEKMSIFEVVKQLEKQALSPASLNKDVFNPIIFYSNKNIIIEQMEKEGIKTAQIAFSEKITSVYRDEIELNPVNLVSYFYHIISAIKKTFQFIKQYDVDILHPHDNLSKIIGSIAGKFAGVKVVTHCHDLLKESSIERLLMIYQLLFINRIITDSNATGEVFRISGKKSDSVVTVYNGIDISRFNPDENGDSIRESLKIEKDITIIGIIGVFDKCKGHMYLFQAISNLVKKNNKDIICVVIGDGREKDEFMKFVLENNISEYVKFLSYRNDIPDLLKIIDIVVMPSIQESFGIVSLEAMAMKVPVIATNVGGLPEAIEDGKTGIIVPPKDIDSLENAIKYLIENPQIRKIMGRAGRKRVADKFSIKSNVKMTEEVYLNVLQNSKKYI